MLDNVSISPGQRRQISRAEYDQLVQRGVLDDERVELINGELVAMSPKGPLHETMIRRLTKLFVTTVGSRAEIGIQCALDVGQASVPEPDLAVVPVGDYSTVHPRHAFLVVEVADSSLQNDREVKAKLYAASSIPEYWIVNLIDQLVEVHTQPLNGSYQSITSHGEHATLSPVAFPDLQFAISDLFS